MSSPTVCTGAAGANAALIWTAILATCALVAVALLAAWLIKTVAGDRHAWVGNAVLQAESTLLHASLTSSYVLPMKNVAQVSAAWDGA